MYRACGTTVSTRGGFFHSRIRARSIRRRHDRHERQLDDDAPRCPCGICTRLTDPTAPHFRALHHVDIRLPVQENLRHELFRPVPRSSAEAARGEQSDCSPLHGFQQTASKLHSFNRYEIKYFVDELRVPELRRELVARMETDPYSPKGGYPVTSLYYDTPDLLFYWEKIEGLKFRRKVRLRLYGEPSDCVDDTPVQIEIKQRVNRVTQKRRIALPYGTAQRWLDGREEIDVDISQRPFVNEVTTLMGNLDLRPIVTTGYLREAYVGTEADLGLRVTIDHKVHGRDRDFHFASGAENRFIILRSSRSWNSKPMNEYLIGLRI